MEALLSIWPIIVAVLGSETAAYIGIAIVVLTLLWIACGWAVDYLEEWQNARRLPPEPEEESTLTQEDREEIERLRYERDLPPEIRRARKASRPAHRRGRPYGIEEALEDASAACGPKPEEAEEESSLPTQETPMPAHPFDDDGPKPPFAP